MRTTINILKHLGTVTLIFLAVASLPSCKKKDDCKTTCQNGGVVNDNCGCDCPAGFTGTFCETQAGQTIEVQGNITSDANWTSNNTYIIKGFVYVKEPATLTIEAGTIIKGDKNTKGTLIIERGAKIMAVGTAGKPIVFTSAQPAGQRDYGDWGGIIICGRAPVNLPGGEGTIEGGVGAQFGGNNTNDNSGKLKYVRIEFSGIAFQPNNEINGLTLGGVGSGTEIEYIQVSYNGDDSFEMFGGSVNLKHIVSFRSWDDDFDSDNGFSGKVQFAVALRDPNIADQSGSNGFESDNDGQGTTATPYTSAIFSNISVFGPQADGSTTINSQFKRAAHLRRNTQLKIYNSIFCGYPTGLLIDGSLCETNAANNDLQFRNNIIAGCATPLAVNSGSTFDITTWFNTSGWNNALFVNNSDLLITNPFNLSAPNFLPATNSPVLAGSSFNNPNLAGFEQVDYRGAFGVTDWTQGWCNFNPQNTNY
ncbi:MAG: T9SS C-terminal target domain-containing protein [Bacteroidia bacterium]|nr:T9SS C-terminal target domain-containing protein [Bacteroidia bacterium]